MWYVTCSAIISHFDPETHFEFYTLLERGDLELSNDISIVFVHHVTYGLSPRHDFEKKAFKGALCNFFTGLYTKRKKDTEPLF